MIKNLTITKEWNLKRSERRSFLLLSLLDTPEFYSLPKDRVQISPLGEDRDLKVKNFRNLPGRFFFQNSVPTHFQVQ